MHDNLFLIINFLNELELSKKSYTKDHILESDLTQILETCFFNNGNKFKFLLVVKSEKKLIITNLIIVTYKLLIKMSINSE